MITETQNIRDLKQWLCWRIEERDGKPTKVPYNPLTGFLASSTNSETWAGYSEAVKACKEHGYDGIGFVFTPEDNLCGVDLDGCLNPESGEIESWAQEIIEELDSYTEISPSGRGIHILLRGSLPAGRNRKGRFEAYDRGRYFTITGRHLAGAPRGIESRQEPLERTVERVLGEPERSNGYKEIRFSEFVSSLSDEEIIERAGAAANGERFKRLWAGDTSGYSSPSEADAALCSRLAFWIGPDPQRIDALFRQSGLCREKWTRREDYRRRTIERALKDRTEFYQAPKVVRLADGTERAVEELQPEEVGILLSGVEPEKVEWLWERWLALRKLALVDGDPGLGKSATTLDLAARISAGKPFPDGAECEPAGVVLLSAEDGLGDTIRPRLDAAGADVSRILALATVPDENGHDRFLSIPEDIPLIETGIERVGARLVVIDPLMAFLSGDTNSHRDQDVRRALAPLAGLAERTGACVLVVRHLNKAPGNNPLYRGGGSIGIIGAARMAFIVGKDPQDENCRVLASTKNNLAKQPKSLMFTLEEADSGAVRVNWLGDSEISAHQLLATPREEEHADARSEAVEFLTDVLADGPVAASQVKEEAEDAGISERTLWRAKKVLGVLAYREGETGSRGKGHWLWKLPILDLADKDCHDSFKGAKSALNENGGSLNHTEWNKEAESRTDKPNSLSLPPDEEEAIKAATTIKAATVPMVEEAGSLKCHHEVEGGCWLCKKYHPEVWGEV
jgi:AAA domain-containing protein/primase/DNA polymerase family protein